MINRSDRTNDIQAGSLENRAADVSSEAEIGPNLSPSQIARYWGVSVRTVQRDIAKGALKAYRLPGGTIRVTTAEARRYGKPIE
jgi:excisionase family DNA binding protein